MISRVLLTTAIGFSLGSVAFAQNVTVPSATDGPAPAAQTEQVPANGAKSASTSNVTVALSDGVSVTEQDRARIEGSIARMNVKSLRGVDFSVSVGSRVPRELRVYRLPAEVSQIVPQYRDHRFLVVEKNTLIVEAKTNKIIAILKPDTAPAVAKTAPAAATTPAVAAAVATPKPAAPKPAVPAPVAEAPAAPAPVKPAPAAATTPAVAAAVVTPKPAAPKQAVPAPVAEATAAPAPVKPAPAAPSPAAPSPAAQVPVQAPAPVASAAPPATPAPAAKPAETAAPPSAEAPSVAAPTVSSATSASTQAKAEQPETPAARPNVAEPDRPKAKKHVSRSQRRTVSRAERDEGRGSNAEVRVGQRVPDDVPLYRVPPRRYYEDVPVGREYRYRGYAGGWRGRTIYQEYD